MQRHNLFSVPIWKSAVPLLEEHNDQLRTQILSWWEQGQFRKHQHGYGYQTPTNLFAEQHLQKLPALRVLRQAFADHVTEILKQRENHTLHLPTQQYAYMAWVLVQTNEDWVNGTWHDHAPAMVSGCYYLQQPETETEQEGALAFQKPGVVDAFVRQVQYVKPKQGDLVMFPSYLSHRPQPCPSAQSLRISINMDAYVHWLHWDESGKPAIHPDRYQQMLEQSLGIN